MRDDAFARMTGEHLFKEHGHWTNHHHETASFQSCERANNKIQSNPPKMMGGILSLAKLRSYIKCCLASRNL
jgi:hypothetical protein